MEVTQLNRLQQGSCTKFKEENIMSMVVQHNLTAMNSNRQLGVTTSGQSKSSEKLSSGYKINRAGDDAAGLKISEKMRSQIRGLNKASSNAQDGVSLIQTAEGALNEAHSILQRMNELTVQGANDTNQDIDRDAINQELTALTTEIDRISQTTQFNKQNLLDGSFISKKLQVGANTNQYISVTITAMNASGIGLLCATNVKYNTNVYSLNGTTYKTQASALSQQTLNASNGVSWNVNDTGIQVVCTGGDVGKFVVCDGNGHALITLANAVAGSQAARDALKAVYDASMTAYKAKTSNTVNATVSTTSATVTNPTVSDYEKAQATLSNIQTAINSVSTQRSALGALQNRLEHTIANLDNVSENTQSAESRIRDTDMASEMVEYSKNNILAQAGQAMLAQANQSTQGVLSLLQ
jgi:flagellin